MKRILVTSAGGGASNNLMKGLRECSLPVFLVGTSIGPYYLFGGIMPSGSSSTPRVARTLDDPLINELCVATVRAVDPRATGLFCIDLKEDWEGLPRVTEINIGRFFMITPLFNTVGRHNMAELYVRLASGELPEIAPQERFGDIGSEETYLVREVDNEPEILTADQIRSRYEDMAGA